MRPPASLVGFVGGAHLDHRETIEEHDPDAFIAVYEARVRRRQFPTLRRK